MSITDELRRLLDERGVKWWPSDERWNEDGITHWYAGILKWTAIEDEDGLWLNAGVAGHNSLTPEQAIAATLGDTDATCERQDVVADVDEILEHIINANMLSMPYDVYFELFDAVAGLGVKLENLQSENANLRGYIERKEHLANIARLIDENAKLRERVTELDELLPENGRWYRAETVEAYVTEIAKLRELVRGMHMAYIGALNECEGMDEGLIWDHCEMVDAELAKSHARFEADRHRFDAAMRELGVELP